MSACCNQPERTYVQAAIEFRSTEFDGMDAANETGDISEMAVRTLHITFARVSRVQHVSATFSEFFQSLVDSNGLPRRLYDLFAISRL